MGLLDRLMGRKPSSPPPAVKAVSIFARDREWTQSALRTGDDQTLPKGLIEQADKSLGLRGALAAFVEQNRPKVQKIHAITEPGLKRHVHHHHPNEPFASVEIKTSFAIYTVVVVGVKSKHAPAPALPGASR